MPMYDIRRPLFVADTNIGGGALTSTAIETRYVDLQHLRGEDVVGIGGKALEAQYKGFIHEEADIQESDILTPDSGTNRYEVLFVRDLYQEHQEFFAKRVR